MIQTDEYLNQLREVLGADERETALQATRRVAARCSMLESEAQAARDFIKAVAKVRASVPQNTPAEVAFHEAWNEYMRTVKP